MRDASELTWIRIDNPDFVPTYLLKQIKTRPYELDKFYRYQRRNLHMETEGGVVMNPFNHLWVLANPENVIKGVLWFTIDPLTTDIIIQSYSVDKEYWGKGLAVKKLAEHIKNIRSKADLRKIFWITKHPKHSEKYGFKRSKMVLMEYNEVKDGSDNVGIGKEEGEPRSAEPGAVELPEPDSGVSDGECGEIVREHPKRPGAVAGDVSEERGGSDAATV